MFALDIFQKSTAEIKWEYETVLVTVSLLTYVVSLAAVFAVAREWRCRCLKRWSDFKNKVPTANGQTGDAPEEPQPKANAAGIAPR